MPGADDVLNEIGSYSCRSVDVEVVWTEGMDLVEREVGLRFADTAVAAAAFATVEFLRVAVHADQEDIQAGEQTGQLGTPRAELDDVFDDQIVAGLGECG